MANILDVFEYNQHFVAMMNIINRARLNPPIKGHKHHIVPKCWFKKNELNVDNSKDNLVLLTPEDHQKVHKLTVMCIIGSDMKSKMGFAVHRLHGSMTGMHHTEETKLKLSKAQKGRIVSEETKRKISEAQKGEKNIWYGKHFSAETRDKMSKTLKGHIVTTETRKKLSESMKGKKKSEEHRRKLSESLKGRIPWNKGKHSKEVMS